MSQTTSRGLGGQNRKTAKWPCPAVAHLHLRRTSDLPSGGRNPGNAIPDRLAASQHLEIITPDR